MRRRRSGACCNPRVRRNSGPEPRYHRLTPAQAARRLYHVVGHVYYFLQKIGAPVAGKIRLEAACSDVERDRERGNKRAYFHVGHKGAWTLCSNWKAGCLPVTHLYGLVLHEFGHPLAQKLLGKSGQEDADQIIWKLCNIPILYKTGWTVQWITPGDVARIRRAR